MNLELVEHFCYQILANTQNPLVSFGVLLTHLREQPECADVDAAELLDFLQHHALFKVLAPLALPANGGQPDTLVALGVSNSPQVILSERVPTPADLQDKMLEEIEVLTAAMAKALEDFERKGATAESQHARALLTRLANLHTRIEHEKL